MSEFTKRYYPTICIRRAEMKAMEMLPASEKVKMLPIVLLAPWLNSIEFENTHAIIEKSIGNGPVIADLDRHFASDSDQPSRRAFWQLIDPETGPIQWMELIKCHENYIPCIQIVGVDEKLIRRQIDFAVELKRGFAIRIELERQHDLKPIFSIITNYLEQDFLFIIDYGYTKQNINAEINVSRWADELFSQSPDLKLVVTGSSFPNSFGQFDDFNDDNIIESRVIYNRLSEKYGNYKFFYGDWSSTKPRSYDGGGSKPLPRIDFPTSDKWIIARSKENDWDFQEAAERITRLPEWQKRPMVWGTGMIEKAAKGLPGGISTGPQAIAARVNIHLYTQNNFDSQSQTPTPQAKWIDPI